MKLFIEEYTEAHAGKNVIIAAREGILRDNIENIIRDIKFLVKKGVHVTLVHNIPDNLGNRSYISSNISISSELFDIERVSKNEDFYGQVLNRGQDVYKIIFLERQALASIGTGKRINTLSTSQLLSQTGDNQNTDLGIENTNYRGVLEAICESVESGKASRVHILPAGVKSTIKKELFSLDGIGTLIGNDFSDPKITRSNSSHIGIIYEILQGNIQKGFLKERNKEYIGNNTNDFFIAEIDGIPVGCVEIKVIDEDTIELGALSVTHSFLSFKIGLSLIEFVENYALRNRKKLISLTNNDRLQNIYTKRGYDLADDNAYTTRRKKSPGVNVYQKKYP